MFYTKCSEIIPFPLAEHVVPLAPVVVHDAHGERLCAVAGRRHVAAARRGVVMRVLAGFVQKLRAVEIAEDRRRLGEVLLLRVVVPACVGA